jgi:hypothetical protein
MASTFPTSLDTIPDAPVAPALGGSTPTHAEMHDLLRDAIAALEATVGTDAAAKLARLLGVLGGQTLIGGTAATDALTLQGTSGDGTATSKAVRVAVGNNGGTEAVTVRNDGNVGIGNTDPSADFTVGTDVLRVDGSLLAIGSGAELGSAATTVPVISNVSATSRAASTLVDYTSAEAVLAIAATVSPAQNKTGNPYKYGLCTEIKVPVGNTYTLSNIYGSVFNIDLAGSGSAGSVVPAYARSYFYGSTCSFLGGVYSGVYHAGSGTVATANSVAAELNVTGGGTITQGWGTEGVISVSGNSTVSKAIPVGVYLSVAAGSTVTNAYGVNIGGPADGWSNAGTLTNCYALYIGSSTNIGTNKWSIYNQSPAVSYFAGSLALGVTAASAKVHAISTTEQLRRGYDASNYLSSTTDSTGKTTFTAVGTAPNLKWLMSDATTNAIYDLVTFSKNSSSAGAAGLGVRVNLAAKSSTTADTLVGAIDASWVDATHASRKGRVKINAYDTAIRECIRAEASGTTAMLGFFGVTAVVRPTALTTQLTTLTYTAPSVADYAIQNLTSTGGFGFVTADEGNSVLAVIKNLQDRVAQLETKLQSLGLLT